jgi:hypothetical protein
MILIQNVLVPYMNNFTQNNPESAIDGQVMGITTHVEIEFTSFYDFFSSIGRWFISFHGILLMLSMVQGFFAGLVMGKLAEGEIKYGFKHALILMTVAFFILSLTQGLAG